MLSFTAFLETGKYANVSNYGQKKKNRTAVLNFVKLFFFDQIIARLSIE
jgi:hypothetical protein